MGIPLKVGVNQENLTLDRKYEWNGDVPSGLHGDNVGNLNAKAGLVECFGIRGLCWSGPGSSLQMGTGSKGSLAQKPSASLSDENWIISLKLRRTAYSGVAVKELLIEAKFKLLYLGNYILCGQYIPIIMAT